MSASVRALSSNDIPLELREQMDRGNVVVLVGASLSTNNMAGQSELSNTVSVIE